MAKYSVSVQAVPRKHHGQEFNDYWYFGRRFSGFEKTVIDLEEEQLAQLRDHQAKGYPIRVLEAVEILEAPPAIESTPMDPPKEPDSTPAVPTTPEPQQPPVDTAKKPWEV